MTLIVFDTLHAHLEAAAKVAEEETASLPALDGEIWIAERIAAAIRRLAQEDGQ